MCAQFYSVQPTAIQNAMGGTHIHNPQSIFPQSMNQTNPHYEAPWLRMPQVPPMTMPWSMPTVQQPDLVRFTGEKPASMLGPILHHKRKLETPDVVDLPHKQLITEEKMAQQFRALHISPGKAKKSKLPTSASCSGASSVQNDDVDLDFSNSFETDMSSSSEPRLVISEELKRLQQEPILPTSLLSKLERPSMALVLWEPPQHLRILMNPSDATTSNASSDGNNNGMNMDDTNDNSDNVNNNSNNSNNSNNNNNEGIPDLNQRMDVNIADSVLEPMDL